jgi:hypothetical protein
MHHKMIPHPDSEEFNEWFSEAYGEYVNSKSPTVENERIRPPGQDIFEWLLEDVDLIRETDNELKAAGFGW